MPLPNRFNTKVVFIAGAGHSGSTMVGMVLGSHPSCFYSGEAGKSRYIGDDRKDLRKRVCKLCGPTCPLWSRFSPDSPLDLYEQLSQLSERPIVVDSTKNLDWIRERMSESQSAGSSPRFVFLQRDGRAVINSRIRKYPDRALEDMIRQWREQMEGTAILYDKLEIPKLELRYEQLATEPERWTRALCELLEIDFREDMLEFYRHPQHPLGGNNGTQHLVARELGASSERPYARLAERNRGYYERHQAGIVLDERWVDELPPPALELFEQLAGETNARFRWGGS